MPPSADPAPAGGGAATGRRDPPDRPDGLAFMLDLDVHPVPLCLIPDRCEQIQRDLEIAPAIAFGFGQAAGIGIDLQGMQDQLGHRQRAVARLVCNTDYVRVGPDDCVAQASNAYGKYFDHGGWKAVKLPH